MHKASLSTIYLKKYLTVLPLFYHHHLRNSHVVKKYTGPIVSATFWIRPLSRFLQARRVSSAVRYWSRHRGKIGIYWAEVSSLRRYGCSQMLTLLNTEFSKEWSLILRERSCNCCELDDKVNFREESNTSWSTHFAEYTFLSLYRCIISHTPRVTNSRSSISLIIF